MRRKSRPNSPAQVEREGAGMAFDRMAIDRRRDIRLIR